MKTVMNSVFLRVILCLFVPFVLALAASKRLFDRTYRDISDWILLWYNIILMTFLFIERSDSLMFKRREGFEFLKSIPYIFSLVYIYEVRGILYGVVDTKNNLPVIRCFVMLTLYTFYNRTLIRKMIDIWFCYVTIDTILSFLVCDEYANEFGTYVKLLFLICRMYLMLMVLYPHFLEIKSLRNTYTSDSIILGLYKKYFNCPNEFHMDLRDHDRELVDRIRWAYAVADIVKETLLLATLMELYYILLEHNENGGRDEYTYTKFLCYNAVSDMMVKDYTDNKRSSLIYFLMQPYVNFRIISCSVLNELRYLAITIWENICQIINVEQFQVGWKRALYISIIVLNAMVVYLIVQNLYDYSVQVIEYSSNHFQNIQVDIGTTRDTQYFSNVNQSDRLWIYERYPGEDVSFQCSKKYVFTTGLHQYRVVWTHNNNPINSSTSDRINISVTYNERYAESKLILMLINENDFGEFKCILQEERYEYKPLIHTYLGHGNIGSMIFEKIIYNRYNQSQNYELSPRTFSENTYEIDEGTFVVFELPAYLSFAELDDLSFRYTVNDVEIFDLCTLDWMSCNSFAFIKKNFIQTETSRFMRKLGCDNITRLTIRFCACSKIFGVHKLVIYRDYHNKTTGKMEYVEIKYPFDLVFLPQDNDTGIKKELFINNTREFISSYLDINDQIVIPIYRGRKLRLNVYSVYNFIATVLYITILIHVLKTANFVMYHYFRLTLIPLRNILLFGTFRQPLPECQSSTFAEITTYKDQLYDVFMSYSESDYKLANIILPYVEDKCNMKVFFPDRDLEAGKNLLHLYTKATQQSQKYIVILSRSYLDDTNCNGLQLKTCILPLITEKGGEGKDLLIIKLETNIDIPVQISRNTGITVIDWTTTKDERHNLRKIKRWLNEFH